MTSQSTGNRHSRGWSASLGIALLLGVQTAGLDHFGLTGSYLVQAGEYSVALSTVARAQGRVTHTLPIINAVAADLSPTQLRTLQHDSRLRITPNRTLRVSATSSASARQVQPYVVERTRANLLHAQGITGRGVTIAFLDTGWWSQ